MDFNTVESFLIILFIALMVTFSFRHLKIPIILGYVLVGTLVGPNVLGWIPNTQIIKDFAEFGVVLLMFTVGLEFSLPKLFSLRYSVFVLGGTQVSLSSVIAAVIGMRLGMPAISSIVVGGVVAMSSTAIVIKQLSSQQELHTKHGVNTVGILLFQDLAVIPVLVLISNLSSTGVHGIWIILLWSLVKGLFAIAAIIAIGKWLLNPLFKMISITRVEEFFTLTVLFVSVGAAWLTNTLGLSYALGAFLAGMMLAECEFKHQITAEIRPFRDLLLGLFFISIGMLVNISLWAKTWEWILLLVVGLVLGKGLLITLLCRIFKNDLITSMRTGLVLAQGGEFGFVILSLALANHLLPNDWAQSILAALLITFVFAPLVIRHNKTLVNFILPSALRNYKQK